MLYLLIIAVVIGLAGLVAVSTIFYTKTIIVGEDSIAITVNKDGFIKRVLPQGRHTLRPYEQVNIAVETKTKLAKGKAAAIATSDGILVKIDWSGTYALQPALITGEKRAQKLRNLPNAEKGISRNVDICLRKLIGNQAVKDLFKPNLRERLERQLSQVVIEKLQTGGIVLNNINLQTIELPHEVAEALNKAKAIETLDGVIRQTDPTTREVVRSAYQLDEILHWDQYLPTPSRQTMKRIEPMLNN